MSDSYDVGFGVIDALLEALERHPLDWQLALAVIAAVVIALIDVT